MLGDSVTTDHISPAGSIPRNGPAAKYLLDHGVAAADWNTFGARRGHHEVMMRGTFGNVRIKNALTPDKEGNWTMHLPSGDVMSIFDASELYRAAGTPLVVLAGKEYGTGSSRDWAAKGTCAAGSQGRHRRELRADPPQQPRRDGSAAACLPAGEDRASLGLSGTETFDITGIASGLIPGGTVTVTARDGAGRETIFQAVVRLNSAVELDYYRHGGILQRVFRAFAGERAEGKGGKGGKDGKAEGGKAVRRKG